MGLLPAVVVAVAVLGVDDIDPADGGRGGRKTVALVRAVAVDFARVCVFVRCSCVLVGEVVAAGFVSADDGEWEEAVGEGLEKVGEGLDGADIDLDAGLVSLPVLMGAGLVVLDGSAWSLAVLCAEGFRTATPVERPYMPEVGRLLGPAVVGRPFPWPVVPARARVAMVEPPGFGSLLGDVVLGTLGAELEAAEPLFRALPLLLLLVFRPAVGCLSDRDRANAEAEVVDDIFLL